MTTIAQSSANPLETHERQVPPLGGFNLTALKLEVRSDRPDYRLGQAISMTADVTYGGAPVDDATVTVVVGKPGQGIGRLRSNNGAPRAAIPLHDISRRRT